MSRPERVGAVLVVKDEVHDIAAWLAWHLALGFDTVFVFDDLSEDGTDHVVKAASSAYDVRLATVGRDFDFFYDRQQNEYKKLLAAAKGEFDWLLFIDSDEYLALPQDDDVHAFLARFPDAHAVAANWRLHGSNGRVLRPLAPPPLAYPRHSDEREAINRHVKSFVRPDRLTEGWHNVHCFPVAPGGYVMSDGSPVVWAHPLGIIQGAATFATACVMHFQNRSMEHLLDRARKRPDLPIDGRAWLQPAWEVREDKHADAFLTRMLRVLAEIELLTSARVASFLGLVGSGAPAAEAPAAAPLRLFTAATHFGSLLQAELETDRLVHAPANAPGCEPALLAAAGGPDVLLVRPSGARRPLRLLGDREASAWPDLAMAPAEEGLITLRSPGSGFFMTAEPGPGGRPGPVRFSRREAKAWERLRPTEVGADALDPALHPSLIEFFAMAASGVTAEGLCGFCLRHPAATASRLLQPLLRRAGRRERLALAARAAHALSAELLDGSQYS